MLRLGVNNNNNNNNNNYNNNKVNVQLCSGVTTDVLIKA